MLKKTILFVIETYRYLLSPFLGGHCRFFPTCSCYAKEAIEKHGVLNGGYLLTKRILRCNPWGGAGVDIVPEKKQKVV